MSTTKAQSHRWTAILLGASVAVISALLFALPTPEKESVAPTPTEPSNNRSVEVLRQLKPEIWITQARPPSTPPSPIFPENMRPLLQGLPKIISSTEMLLSNGLRIRSTLLESTATSPERTLLLEWMAPHSEIVQWGLFDPSRVKIFPSPSTDSWTAYEAISSPKLDPYIYSSLEDEALVIHTELEQHRLVDFVLQMQHKSGSLASVELVPIKK